MPHHSELELRPGSGTGVDFASLFDALPTAFLVMTPALVIVDANKAYLALTNRTCADLVGRYVFDAFPPTADALDERGRNPVQLSFESARDRRRLHQMPLTNYDLYNPATGALERRYWSLISAPVLDDDGKVALILQRVEDVTDFVEERRRGAGISAEDRRWVELSEADLLARNQELQTALAAEARAKRRLAGLTDGALLLAGAETIEQLVDVVADAGRAALGVEGAAIAVANTDGTVRLSLTQSLGEEARLTFTDLPADSDIPAAWAIRHARPVLLPDRASGEKFSPQMRVAYETTGRLAWAIVPMFLGERVIGSLVAGWMEEREFSDEELDLLNAFAAQCAQTLDRIQARDVERREAAQNRQISEALQRSLLTDPPHVDQLHIAVRYLPASSGAQVGGDWYDAFATTGGTTTLVIGDVTGHDLTAAAAMGQIRNVLRGVANVTDASPAAVLTALDRTLATLAVNTLATCALTQVAIDDDSETAVVSWSNAGHLPPLLLTAAGNATLLTSEADLLLGLDPAAVRRDHRVSLVAGATILLYTDGLVERRGESLDVGLERLRASAAELSRLPVERLCDALLARLADGHLDDIALLAVRLEGTRT